MLLGAIQIMIVVMIYISKSSMCLANKVSKTSRGREAEMGAMSLIALQYFSVQCKTLHSMTR